RDVPHVTFSLSDRRHELRSPRTSRIDINPRMVILWDTDDTRNKNLSYRPARPNPGRAGLLAGGVPKDFWTASRAEGLRDAADAMPGFHATEPILTAIANGSGGISGHPVRPLPSDKPDYHVEGGRYPVSATSRVGSCWRAGRRPPRRQV